MAWSTICLGLSGGLGVLARHFVQKAVPRSGPLPWGTFLVNVSGALAAGLLLAVLARRLSVPLWVHESVFVGFLGGYTTFSALSVETFSLLESRHYGLAALYSLGSVSTGILAVFAGTLLGRWVA
jgi:CrcB protein